MKRFIVIVFCFTMPCYISRAQTPNFKEWFLQKKTQLEYLLEQIAALKVYLEYLKKGYEVAQKGLSTIELITDGSFSRHKDYFNSLKQVSPVVANSSKVNEVLLIQQQIIGDFKNLLQDIRGDQNLNPDEIEYIQAVYQGMLITGNAFLDELTVITTSGEVEMKDDERLLRLDKIHEDVLHQYSFVQDFIACVSMLSVSRAKERSQWQSIENLYSN